MSDCASIREQFFAAGQLDRGNPVLEAHLEACAECRAAASALPLVDAALAELPRFEVAPPAFEAIAAAANAAARSRRREKAVRRSLPFFLTGAAAAAAAALLAVFVAGQFLPGKPERIAIGARLESAGDARVAALDSGAQLRLAAGSVERLASPQGEERLFLPAGIVALEVPKLPAGHAVSVSTPDAEVRVHGTRFQVVRDAAGTAVSVAEGLVEVRPAGGGREIVFVRAGESTSVQPAEVYRSGLRTEALAAIDRAEYEQAERQLERLLKTDLAPAERAEAHALFAWSLAAAGNRGAAIARYRESLAGLPASARPLWADNAAAELALLLEQQTPGEALEAWRDYLRRFPEGVHAARARARVAEEGR